MHGGFAAVATALIVAVVAAGCATGDAPAADADAGLDADAPHDSYEDAAETDGGGGGDADADVPAETDGGPEDSTAEEAPGDGTDAGDGEADALRIDDDGDTVAVSEGDCDDGDPRVYPGATGHVEGVDYDCDGRREFMATIVVTADDAYDLCVNGRTIATGIAEHVTAETYQVVMDSGRNVIGVHGYDTVGVTAAMAMWVGVAGMEIVTDGVRADEPDITAWRYYPSEVEEPQATWCDVVFDDGEWGPALFNAEQDDGDWLDRPYELRGRGVEWVWDGRPRELHEAWFRRRIDVPDEEPPSTPAATDACEPAGTPVALGASAAPRLHNGVALAWTGAGFAAVWSEWFAPWSGGCDEVFLQGIDPAGVLVGTPTRLTTGTWWNTFPDVAFGADILAVVEEDGRNDRKFDQLYLAGADSHGAVVGTETRLTTTSGWSKRPSIAFDGANFGIAWQDDRDGGNGAFEIYFARVAPRGAPVGPQVRLTDSPGSSRIPSLAWGGTQWGVAWEDVRDGNPEIYFTRASREGVEAAADVRVTDSPAVSTGPSLAWSGDRWGLAWEDEREGNREIFFAVVGADGTPSAPVRVTEDGASSSGPSVVWDGSGWTIAWTDGRDGNDEIYAVRLDPAGARIGGDGRITTSDGRSWHPDLVRSGAQYGVVWEEEADPAAAPYEFRARFGRFDCP